MKDCKLVVDLFDKLKKVVNLVQMGQVTGCFAVDILNRGQGIRTITLMQYYCKEKNIFIPRTDKSSDGFQELWYFHQRRACTKMQSYV